MWTMLSDLGRVMSSGEFWRYTLRMALLVSFGLAILLLAFTTMVVVLPIALIGGLALHLYLRRKLRQAYRQAPSRRTVIEGEYTVLDR